ncbi:Protein LNK1 [Arabidopsis thaliana]
MSDLYIHELGDYLSDEFHGNDDGIVPDSAYEDGGQFPILVSNRKKRRNDDMGSGTTI